MAHVVAVEEVGAHPSGVQFRLDDVGDRRLARTRQAGEPEHSRLVGVQPGAGGLVDLDVLPVDVVRAAQGEVQQTGADGDVGELVDHDEAAGVTVDVVRVERDRPIETDVAHPDLVEFQRVRGEVFEVVDVDAKLRLRNRGTDGAGTDLHQIRPSGQHGVFVHPHDVRLELVGDLSRIVGRAQQIASARVDLVGECDRDRLTGDGFVEVAVHRDDAIDGRRRARRQHPDRVAGLDGAADDASGEPAEVEVGTVHPLHRHPERLLCQVVVDRHRLEEPQQRRAVIPRGVRTRFDDVVALQCRQRYEGDVVEADAFGEVGVLVFDRREHLVRVVHQVHLVDGDHHPLDAQQRHQVAVAAGLGEYPFARVDQDDRHVRGGRAGDHVAGVLLVTWCVGHDELAALGGEESIRHIDRDALFAFGRQPVEQQGEVEVAALGADLGRIGLERGEVILEHQVRLVEQAPDQGALAIIDRAARDEPQQALVLMLRQVLVDVLCDEILGGCARHQKWPSCFFFSNELMPSWSATRPWRSDVVASNISWMIRGNVSAVDSIAPVSG